MSKLIYLSPSNHGEGQNKCLLSGCYEDKHTRPIAEACAKYLKKAGFTTIIGKPSQNMAARCEEADEKGADLYVPIHTNASSSESARYLLFMFYQDNATYRKLFDAVAPCLEAIYPGNEKAHFSARTDLYEIKAPSAKTIYCELGFHTNGTDVKNFIHDPKKVGTALARGILKYFSIPFENQNTQPDNNDGTGSGANSGSGSAQKPQTGNIVAGTTIRLSAAPLYASSTAKVPSTHVTGTYYLWDNKVVKGRTYYLWDNKVVKGRIRITNVKSRVEKDGQVTGWINKADI